MTNIDKSLDKYADLIVRVGINLQAGEGLIITSNFYGLPLTRLITAKAYAAGAKHVELLFNDEIMTLERYQNGHPDIFDTYPEWKVNAIETMYQTNYHHLFIISPNPELLSDIPAALVARDQKAAAAANAPLMRYRTTSKTKWCIAAVPSPAWAKTVFPKLSESEATEQLWTKICEATRVDLPDPVSAWQTHDKQLKAYKQLLNDEHFEKLHLKAPGTDLEVYLAKDHFWMGGSKISEAGCSYVANMPTEEVFTTPHMLKVNGTLKATKPLNLNGKLIEDFSFVFESGKVVKFEASKGREVLEQLFNNDEGASYLGEVALVQHDSPISNTGILFNNTLFDENASVHFAFGRAYPYAIIGGTKMTEAELLERGANQSFIHVDFMVGCEAMDIIAYRFDGSQVQLFKNGNWAL